LSDPDTQGQRRGVPLRLVLASGALQKAFAASGPPPGAHLCPAQLDRDVL